MRLALAVVTAIAALLGGLTVVSAPAHANHCSSSHPYPWLSNPACADDKATEATAWHCLDSYCDSKAIVKLRSGTYWDSTWGRKQYAWATYDGPARWGYYIRLRVLLSNGAYYSSSSRLLTDRLYTAGHSVNDYRNHLFQACVVRGAQEHGRRLRQHLLHLPQTRHVHLTAAEDCGITRRRPVAAGNSRETHGRLTSVCAGQASVLTGVRPCRAPGGLRGLVRAPDDQRLPG
ncbi:MAG: hypothetical protein ACRDT4_22615 [Micromonosporaceae bacterium]